MWGQSRSATQTPSFSVSASVNLLPFKGFLILWNRQGQVGGAIFCYVISIYIALALCAWWHANLCQAFLSQFWRHIWKTWIYWRVMYFYVGAFTCGQDPRRQGWRWQLQALSMQFPSGSLGVKRQASIPGVTDVISSCELELLYAHARLVSEMSW
ncbi:hypothetical protein GOP47_0009262 [Adiantum capillus-veneris]|uniref:Uncharacterized protein n=1 Tax=Adiantum capillus-veneris TaxID=13818 RepID=A0A9D4UWE9_ADICA|nr:hypothetical protein GOP47_0009262 [Adiantum capillus-veneris]